MIENSAQNIKHHEILIVDDTPANLHLLTNILKEYGYRIRPASSGNLALRSLGVKVPDLIILDVRLPDISGFEVCKKIKAEERYNGVPVMFISALGDTAAKVEGFKVGGVDYVTKPFEAEEVIARVRTQLRLRELNENLEQQVRDRTEKLTEANVHLQQEIAERKYAEEELRKSEERYRGLYENATLGIYRSNREGNVLMANPALVSLLGYADESELLSMINVRESIYKNPDDRAEFIYSLETDGFIYGFEAEWKRADGEVVFIRESARAIKNKENITQYYEGVVENITKQKKAEQEIIKAKEKAEQSDVIKSEFLAQMSHEIRTPINTILSFTNLIKDEIQDKIDDELRTSFNSVDRAGRRIIRTIDMILNMSEIQIGSYEYTQQVIDVYNDVLFSLFAEFKVIAAEKNLDMTLIKLTNNPNILADGYSVIQIFNNLIDNSIKYTNKGKIKITVDRDNEDRLFVDISDTGIGISEEYIPNLFSSFTQEEQGYTRKFEGNGLGLALVKKYCELNNAEVEVKSEKNVGSTFRIIFNHP